MRRVILVLSLLALAACSTAPAARPAVVEKECPPPPEPTIETSETEQYRHQLGVAYAHALLTSMNLNAVLLARIENANFGEQDHRVLDDNLIAVRDLRKQYRVVLDQLYEDPARRRRDRAMIPLIDSAFRATESLDLYADSRADPDREAYTDARKAFVEKIREIGGK